ncbi:MAG TPA: rhodanese-like domain-containing protein [Pyrinomonadaceae bacterium]|nr:rhodanese-like domain-containing protein [Pyrinomonadaceae bacterium]
MFQIIAFYEFKDLTAIGELTSMRGQLKDAFVATGARGTIIIAVEGYNGMVCGTQDQIKDFIARIERVLHTHLSFKSSFHETAPFRKIDVKIKPEIVTLKQPVNIELGAGTHVPAQEWNEIISDPGTLVLDARNDYEYQSGTFRGAINPGVTKFSDLPAFVAENLDPEEHKRVAMFCTGGIRCEKFAPYLKQIGFEEVYQLEGGILKYLEEARPSETLWQGECFVFDERITVSADLRKGTQSDLSQRRANMKKSGEQPGQ